MTDDPAATTEFPTRMGTVAPRELAIHGVGPEAIRILEDEPAARGLSFGDR